MSNDKPNDNVELLLEMAKLQGVACSTVKDGHVLVFRKESLKKFLDELDKSGKDQMVVFVKRADMGQAS